MSWKRRTPASNRRRRHRRELGQRRYHAVCESLRPKLLELNAIYSNDPEAMKQATANLLAEHGYRLTSLRVEPLA